MDAAAPKAVNIRIDYVTYPLGMRTVGSTVIPTTEDKVTEEINSFHARLTERVATRREGPIGGFTYKVHASDVFGDDRRQRGEEVARVFGLPSDLSQRTNRIP